MKSKRILEQMGIQQWRLTDASENENFINLKETPISSALELESVSDKQLPSEVDLGKPDQTFKSIDRSPPVVDKDHDWSSLVEILNDKQHCSSCAQVTPILGQGNTSADWLFVVDSPTARDIQQQELLTGRVGQLFDAILCSLNLDQGTIYLSSIFKCPPALDISADPAQCNDLLQHQISLIKPKVVIAFGEFVAQSLIKANEDLQQLREQRHTCFDQSVNVIPTYSLMQMLDTPIVKASVWDDLKRARVLLES